MNGSSYGKGSIKETKVGKYTYYTARYYDNCGKQQAKRFPFTKAGAAEAKRFLKEISQNKENGVKVVCTYTVSSWIETFIQSYKLNKLRDSSLERMLQSYDKIAVSPIGSIPLDKLKGITVQNFYNMLTDSWTDVNGKKQKPLSSSSISKIHKLLVSAYKKAVQQREIPFNVMDTVDPVKVRTKEMSVFTWKEIGRIFRAIDKVRDNKHNSKQRYDYRLLFMMLLETGCRVGELLALRWEDINFHKREIHIHSTKVKGKQEFNDTKTKAGNRYVPIVFDKMLARLKEYRSAGSVIKLQGYVFENQHGGAMEYRRVLEQWKHVCKLTGIDKNIHTFRHTAATYLLEKGVPVAEVSRILGHADATITYKMYVHAIPGYNSKIIEMFRKDTEKDEQVQKQVQKIRKVQ